MENRSKKIVRTSIIGVLTNLGLVALKAVVGLFANSISIIMDAINNLSDALSSVITIVGTKLAQKKPDAKHPFGHGRIEYVTSLVISIIILVAGSAAIAESNLRMEVRISLFTMRLRRFFFSLTFTRFFADWIFGNSVHLPLDDKKPSLRILSCMRVNCKTFFPENITKYMPELRDGAPA